MARTHKYNDAYKRYQLIREYFEHHDDKLTEEEIVHREKCEKSLHQFVMHFWHIVEGTNPFVDGKHIHAICDHLEAGVSGQIEYLVLNMPPRHMKSLLCSVFLPAWVWTTKPQLSFLNISGDMDLAIRDNVSCRRIITSPEFKHYWGAQFHLYKDVNAKKRYKNTMGGEKIIKSITSSSMGEGAHIKILDDPNSSQDIDSETTRERTNNIIDRAISTRNKPGGINFSILVQQRVHEFDATGHFLSLGHKNVVHLVLPLEFEEINRCVTIPLRGMKEPWQDFRSKDGDVLWPELYDLKAISRLKIGLNSEYHRSSQLQQRPSPATGTIIKREWFKVWRDDIPNCEYTIQSWDTAVSNEITACDSAVTTWGLFKNDNGHWNIILLNAWSGKLQQPDLRKMVKKCYYNYYTSSFEAPHYEGPQPTVTIIEEVGNSLGLIQDLRRGGMFIYGFSPRSHGVKNENDKAPGSKVGRARLASQLIENGLVWIPTTRISNYRKISAAASVFVDAALKFPHGGAGSKDFVDSMSQAFLYIMKTHLVYMKGEEPEDNIDYKNIKSYEHSTRH